MLLERLAPVFRGLSMRLAGADLTLREDFFQEGAIAALAALQRYDKTKGLVEHFAARSIRGRLLNYQWSVQHHQREACIGTFAEANEEADSQMTLAFQREAFETAVDVPAFDAMGYRLIHEIAVAANVL